MHLVKICYATLKVISCC